MIAASQACPTNEVDSFANALLTMTDDSEKELSILLILLRADILSTTDSVQILRSNTVATRMVALYSNNEAHNYLIDVFKPVFDELIDGKEFFDLHHVDERSTAENDKNISLFMKYLNKIVDAITASVDAIPFGLRAISKTIFTTTAINFPESKFAALGYAIEEIHYANC
ncbi:unnamed protein product [Ambrosiozyma monospora]|uniref:Unnamed protein product n=1 Tax=Ambrosiozyma monospora TaxID=43982 RepID=A0ACB5U343_AMBMO|nr:unnamed protein product [Ambrosiozyma monospora]